MSYSIFYRAMFLKMSDGTFIPMIESGDNNVWEVGRNRRAREWTACRWLHESDEQRRLFSLAEKDIIEAAQNEIDKTLERYVGTEPAFGGEKYTREAVLSNLGFFNGIKVYGRSETSAAAFLGFIKSGIRNAVTWDDLAQLGCSVHLGWYEEGGNYRREYAASENELAEKWAKCLEEGVKYPWIGFSECVGDVLWRKVQQRRPKVERKKPTEFFVIGFSYQFCERYVVELTSRNLKFNPFKDSAHRYASRKVAENVAERIGRRFSQVSNIRVELATA